MDKLVSVVMSVYNTPEEFLRSSISSILVQTYRNFEFLVVNDCSDEPTTAILREYAQSDSRVRLIENEENCGLAKSLNRAIRQAKGAYIARMDADDMCANTRLERQIAFMEKYPDVSVLGTECMSLDGRTLRKLRRYENQPWQIQGRLLFGCQGIMHPSVVFRADVFTKDGLYYNDEFRIAQDFELWTRVGLGHKIYVLPEPLLYYRVSDVQVSVAKKDRQIEFRTRVILKELGFLGIDPTEEEKTLHVQLAHGKEVASVKALGEWTERLLAANRKRKLYDPVAFEYYVRKRQLDSAGHTLSHRGPSPRNVAAVIKALFLARKASKAFSKECEKRGNPYAFD